LFDGSIDLWGEFSYATIHNRCLYCTLYSSGHVVSKNIPFSPPFLILKVKQPPKQGLGFSLYWGL